jgi:hypothetical protein
MLRIENSFVFTEKAHLEKVAGVATEKGRKGEPKAGYPRAY